MLNSVFNRFFCSSRISQEKEIFKHLKKIIDPDLKKDIVSLGFVKNLEISEHGRVNFNLQLTTPACPVKEQFIDACKSVLMSSGNPWIKSVHVTLSSKPMEKGTGNSRNGLDRVRSIIAVASCKGGVGKSSIATNLAFMIANEFGGKVGLLDADIYGPSLPTLVPTDRKAETIQEDSLMMQPYLHAGVKLMSIGYLRPNRENVAALRGPMVSGIVQQMLTMTGWGELDYLIIDLPPGTGDIQITVGQQAKLDGAVVVTTPQKLSIVDVEKGIELFNKLNIPSLAIVENLSYFVCNNCNERHEIFDKSGRSRQVAERYGIDHTIQIPIEPRLAQVEETTYPYVMNEANRNTEVWELFKKLADTVIRGISKNKFEETEFIYNTDNANEFAVFQRMKSDGSIIWNGSVSCRSLRLACKSALMIDEWTGEKRFREEDIPMDVKPSKIESAGRYALRVHWSDGHQSIYPFKAIKELCDALS